MAGGPCTPWITGADLAGRPDIADSVRDTGVLTSAATTASGILFVSSGRQWTGLCGPTTVRPISGGQFDAGPSRLPLSGPIDSMQAASNSVGLADQGLKIGLYPIRSIVQIKIDGAVLSPTKYRLDEGRYIERRDGNPWPSWQRLDFDDTQVGTFSVTVTHGADPPAAGVDAASALGAELAKSRAGLPNRLPQRLTSLTRQGVTMAVLDPMAFLEKGLTGVYETDLWIQSVNPHKQTRRPAVWSPDTARHRRTG
jgi:hypothetical protein